MAERPRFASLHGLAFGDCGKGKFVDALCRHWGARTVVRFNGGAQAGHNVVLPNGTHHTFSQFGAAGFMPGVHTLLSSQMVVHATALVVEAEYLHRLGVRDALKRLLIDSRCLVTTPFHQAAGRLRELQRGTHAHGSCGVGVGETVACALANGEAALRYGDLLHPALAMEKLQAVRSQLRSVVETLAPTEDAAAAMEARTFADERVASVWLARAQRLAAQVRPRTQAEVAQHLNKNGTVVFEGAQGMLLDEGFGFHPHTTWSRTGPGAARAVLADAGIDAPMQHFGVLRSYLTRHGPGPFPTQDDALNALAEPHNTTGPWQGAFRRGHADEVLLRYAVQACGGLDGLLISHLDAFERGAKLKWCSAYLDEDDSSPTRQLALGQPGDLAHQEALTALLKRARPVYVDAPMAGAAEFLERVSHASACQVLATSVGPTHQDVSWIQP